MTQTDEIGPELLERVASKLITLAEATELSGLSKSQLRLLVGQGVIWGIKIGRDWVTTREAVEAYINTERKPGPKPHTNEG